MNVFVLTTGRSGSMTFAKACGHITNFTSGHETRGYFLGPARLGYPDQHIEVDNRLSWLLGRLDQKYGDNAVYVHLRRNPEHVALSYARRAGRGIMQAYCRGIITGRNRNWRKCAADMAATIDANIQLFLRDKAHRLEFHLERAEQEFPRFWNMIGAAGDIDAAIAEFLIRYNAS